MRIILSGICSGTSETAKSHMHLFFANENMPHMYKIYLSYEYKFGSVFECFFLFLIPQTDW